MKREIPRKKKKLQTNRQLNMYHEEIKDKGRGFGRTRDSQEKKGRCYQIMLIGELAELPEKKVPFESGEL